MLAWRIRRAAAAAVVVVSLAMVAFADASSAVAANGRIAVELWDEDCSGTLDCFNSHEGVVLVQPDGRETRRLPLSDSFDPRFSADGRFLAVRVENRGIAVGPWNASRFRFVDRASWSAYEGMDWSPRSDQLVFAKNYESASGEDTTRLIRVSAQTSERRTLGTGRDPAWSPNGRWIAFDDAAGGASQVMIMRPDGRGRRALTHFRDVSLTFVERWSADGHSVLFEIAEGGAGVNEGLFAVNVATGATRRVMPSPRPLEGVPSPDGRLLATSDRRGVYVTRRDGTNRRRIVGPPQQWGVDGYTVAGWQRVP